MLSRIDYFLSEAWVSFRRSGVMSLVAIGIITVSLVIFGAFLLSILNLGNIVSKIGERLEVIAYVNSPMQGGAAENLQLKISQITGVEKVKYISRDEAWSSFKSSLQGRINLSSVVLDNPLPETFVITVRNPDLISGVVREVTKLPEIDEVRYSGALIEKTKTLIDAFRIGGVTVVFLLAFATLLIVVNTIRLTVLARETDISIMKLVGATHSFIKWPFVLEGVLLGIIGSILAISILIFFYSAVIFKIAEALPFLPLVSEMKGLILIYMIVFVVGTLLGMLGGYISVSKSLKE